MVGKRKLENSRINESFRAAKQKGKSVTGGTQSDSVTAERKRKREKRVRRGRKRKRREGERERSLTALQPRGRERGWCGGGVVSYGNEEEEKGGKKVN